jgi:hypothetical protein
MDTCKKEDAGSAELLDKRVNVRDNAGALKGYISFDAPMPLHVDVLKSKEEWGGDNVTRIYQLIWHDLGNDRVQRCIKYYDGIEKHARWREDFPAQALR